MITHEELYRESNASISAYIKTPLQYLALGLMVSAFSWGLYMAAWFIGIAPVSNEEKDLIYTVINSESTKNNSKVLAIKKTVNESAYISRGVFFEIEDFILTNNNSYPQKASK